MSELRVSDLRPRGYEWIDRIGSAERSLKRSIGAVEQCSVDEIDPKLRAWGMVLGIVFLALAGLDFVVLKGESVGGGTVDLREDGSPLVLTIDRVGEDHLVEIRTRRRVRGEKKGQSIAFRLVDPDGRTLVEESEVLSHKRRTFTFHPMKPGAYSLYAHETNLLGGSRGQGRVSVTVNDRRILAPLVGF